MRKYLIPPGTKVYLLGDFDNATREYKKLEFVTRKSVIYEHADALSEVLWNEAVNYVRFKLPKPMKYLGENIIAVEVDKEHLKMPPADAPPEAKEYEVIMMDKLGNYTAIELDKKMVKWAIDNRRAAEYYHNPALKVPEPPNWEPLTYPIKRGAP